MAIKTKNNKYRCSFCNKEYVNAHLADVCRDSHGLIYIPLTKAELNNLIMFFQLGDPMLVSEELMQRLEKYKRQALLLDSHGDR